MHAVAFGLLAVNLCAVALYAWDKHAARRGTRRVPEARLHLLALLGGWPGAWLGQRLFRHKTRKAAFQRRFTACVALNLAMLGFWLWR